MKNILILGKYSSLEAGGIERVVESWLRCVDQLDETVFFHHVCFNGRHIRCQKRLERHYSEAAFRVTLISVVNLSVLDTRRRSCAVFETPVW